MLSEQNLFKVQSDPQAIVKNWSSGHKKKSNMIQRSNMSRVNILLKVRCNLILSSLGVIRLRIYLSRLSTKAGEEFPVEGEADNEGHVQTFAEMPVVE